LQHLKTVNFNATNCTTTEVLVDDVICLVFMSSNQLQTLNIGDNVTNIPYWLFAGCGFITITIPNSVISIGDYAFYGCS